MNKRKYSYAALVDAARGKTIREVAEIFRCDEKTVWNACKKLRVSYKRAPHGMAALSPEKRREACKNNGGWNRGLKLSTWERNGIPKWTADANGKPKSKWKQQRNETAADI